ncbi:SusC/RagA family TonB-linked outer membrane protein [Membranihabitans maritimus]|uniref:SusC/RagA family TonB-linked outer membrane protein n=1 Tax=Membranihabitans maritimus TaxID=2904244 RepID=UPI001F40C2DF|nr:TonB-dependent receptor [Membranihabitans maritimus]
MNLWIKLILVQIVSMSFLFSEPAQAYPIDDEKRQLIEVLRELSEKYQVVITYDTNILKDIEVQVGELNKKDLEGMIESIMEQTGLQYENMRNRYYIIYRDTWKGNKSMKKIRKKLNQIETIDLSGKKNNITKNLQKVHRLNSVKRAVLQLETAMVVRGTVTDDKGEPLIGVNVLVKGENNGTSTDFNGSFELQNVDEDATLVFSYVGYQTQEVAVEGRESIQVELLSDAQLLDELVVVGYGTVKKSDLTGSVARIDGDDFKRQPITQLTEMLSGTVPGFYSRQSASAAGGGSMQIRGQNSLSAQTDPMIVLDGVIFNGSLQEINPSDIESIDILKDASSAAIYGARAASGVILITTNRGTEGAPRINFSTKLGIAQPTQNREPLNAEQFLQFRQDYLREISIDNPDIPQYFYTNPNALPSSLSLEQWLSFRENPSTDPYSEYLQRLNLYPIEQKNALANQTIDWYPKVVNTGIRQRYDLNLSGGTERVKYYWSMGYLDNEGVIKGDEYSSIQTRLNVDFKITDWLSVGTNTQFTNRDEGAVQANLGQMYINSPFGEEYNEDGTINLRPYGDPGTYNPLMDYYGQEKDRKINSLFSSLYSNISLPFGIEYKLSFQPRMSFTNELNFWNDQTITGSQTYQGGYATRYNARISEWMIDNLLKWQKQIGNHLLDLTFLYNSEKYQSWSELQSNQTFNPNQNLGYNGLQFGTNPSLNNDDSKQTGDALMGRVNYTLLDRYLITASVRRDGYSAFGQEQPRAIFPALAFAWKLSDENFFPGSGFVNRVKLRASWGINGNRDIGAYSALARLSSSLDYDGINTVVGVQNSSLANPGLVWEKTTSLNFGADIGIWENRIDLSLDYYVGETRDLLMNRLLPIITGFSSVTSNLGRLENRGFEMSVRSINFNSSKFSWNSNLVFSLNRNKIVSLFGDVGEYTLLGETHNGELPDFTNNWFPGYAVDAIWDYNVTGVWQIDEKDEAGVFNMSPGDYKGEDVNGDGKYIDVEDKQFIGFTTPRYLVGFRNNFDFGPFSLSMFIRGDLGHKIQLNEALRGTLSHDRRNYDLGPLPYWTPENRNNEFARLRPIHSAYGGGLNIYKPGSFVRIQDLTLSYSFDSALLQRLNIKGLSTYLSGRNLLTIDNWPGWDPESRMTPMPRIMTLGVDISL